MTKDAYSLLLLNGQSIPISNFVGELDRFEFDSSTDLTNERSCWLRDSRDGELTEVRILRSDNQSPRSWRYVAEAMNGARKTAPPAAEGRRGLRRFLMPWSRA
jgi:hypothetical protein